MHHWWLWLSAILLISIVTYLIWGRTSNQPNTAGQSFSGKSGKRGATNGGILAVGVALAKTADVPIYLSGLGSVTPEATTIVRSRVDGQLMKVHFHEGQIVKAGDLLAELDSRPYQVMVMQAEGVLARDSALLKAAQIDLERYHTLLIQDSIARQQVDTQTALVKQLEGTVKSDQGSLDNARLQLTYSRITAPISGRLGLRQVDIGNIVHSSDANGVVVITRLQPITGIFSIPEDHIPSIMQQLQAGKTLPTDAWDRSQSNKLASGTLLTIDNQIDSSTGTVKLKATFPNANYALFPNQFINIRMLLDTRKDATVIPSAAIQRGSKGNFVYVVKPDNSVTIRPVSTGPVEGEQTVIEKGIAVGETVVIDGLDKLREGAKVALVKRDSEAAATGTPKHGAHHRRHDSATQ